MKCQTCPSEGDYAECYKDYCEYVDFCDYCGAVLDENNSYHNEFGACDEYCYGKLVGIIPF